MLIFFIFDLKSGLNTFYWLDCDGLTPLRIQPGAIIAKKQLYRWKRYP